MNLVDLFGFNWATSFQTWIEPEPRTINANDYGFQLGHVFSDMDCGPGDRPGSERNSVSIGPRLFRHGLDTSEFINA